MENLSKTLDSFSPHIPSEYKANFEENKRNLYRFKAGFIALPGHSKSQKYLRGLQENGIFEVEI